MIATFEPTGICPKLRVCPANTSLSAFDAAVGFVPTATQSVVSVVISNVSKLDDVIVVCVLVAKDVFVSVDLGVAADICARPSSAFTKAICASAIVLSLFVEPLGNAQNGVVTYFVTLR